MEPIPSGKKRIIIKRKIPSESCQLFGKYKFENDLTISNRNEAMKAARIVWWPARIAINTKSPDVVQKVKFGSTWPIEMTASDPPTPPVKAAITKFVEIL